MLSRRTRAHTKWEEGYGGRYCACCGISPSEVKKARRANGSSPAPGFFLSGAGEHDRVELTEQLHAILKQVVQALSNGQSIRILTRDQEISTQQTAEILGVSRPTVVKLIEDGELSAHVPGAVRRKLRLADVLAYREELRARRNRFITESAAAEYDEGLHVLDCSSVGEHNDLE